ncbi:MAG: acetyl-CoA carboxylase biotin carboxyl carrier protein [Betaproteobacteria bacterium]|nr:MAG: acetyl-CoA carboxylase biotin carboxyl carrier protein [Betaproteobacteria bacterium]
MTHDNLTYDDLLRIVELIKSSEQFSEFRLKIGEIEIELRRRRGAGASRMVAPTEAAPAALLSTSPAAESKASDLIPPHDPTAGVAPVWAPESIVIRAPVVGTFYRAREPGAPPFVEIGQVVEPDTIVCIIEVMKLMNSIRAGARGVVTQVLLDDGATVEASAPLIILDPEPAP